MNHFSDSPYPPDGTPSRRAHSVEPGWVQFLHGNNGLARYYRRKGGDWLHCVQVLRTRLTRFGAPSALAGAHSVKPHWVQIPHGNNGLARYYWRKGRDSNPRDRFRPNGFQDRRDRPLCHPSGINQFEKCTGEEKRSGVVGIYSVSAGGQVAISFADYGGTVNSGFRLINRRATGRGTRIPAAWGCSAKT